MEKKVNKKESWIILSIINKVMPILINILIIYFPSFLNSFKYLNINFLLIIILNTKLIINLTLY